MCYHKDRVQHFLFILVTERSIYGVVEGGGEVGDVVRRRRREGRRRRGGRGGGGGGEC